MDLLDFVGQTLDGKYHIERELGRGGMGTVYLATHLGTERPVAVKIISPQFMQRSEFVERFRREARAAGRLRHPNVVDVTDFGFSDTKDGQVAYLVMEYLDGCTLGEILDEEKNLPVSWTLDILEQVCSAVQEAHDQGIIHRDLKPDNIWLEPNQRGGYTVKVLDFGIAKLEEHVESSTTGEIPQAYRRSTHTYVGDAQTTFGGHDRDTTVAGNRPGTHVSDLNTIVPIAAENRTLIAEGGTLLLEPIGSEGKTAIFDGGDMSIELQDSIGTQVITEVAETPNNSGQTRTTGRSLLDSSNSAELTRVGAVLGTPLYMSPEQCRGEHLDPRSDIYSLGVIAYQMLSGAVPFSGDFKEVMEAHKLMEPPPLTTKRVRKKLRAAIHSALSKHPDERPQTAEAFTSVLRARSEGIVELLRRALVIYTEHLPKFLILTTLFALPVIILTFVQTLISFLRVSDIITDLTGKVILGSVVIFVTLVSAFCATLTIGSIVWIVTQYLSVPLRPVRLRPALKEVGKNWKRITASGAIAAFTPILAAIIASIATFVVVGGGLKLISMATGASLMAPEMGGIAAFFAGAIAFFWLYVWCMLVTPVAMMEKLRIRDGFKRSRELTKRAFVTALAAAMIMFLIPMVMAGSLSFFVNVTAKAFDPQPKPPTETVPPGEPKAEDGQAADAPTEQQVEEAEKPSGFNFSFSRRPRVNLENGKMDMRDRLKHTILESLIQIFWLPIQIVVLSFSAIIVALLYLKTRLAGGESMNDLIERFEDDGRPTKKWQERVRQRLIQSGRISSNPSR
ncbi:hypothetical protein BH10ACI2_BH10ACI2_13250 [soil metagenome]